MKKKTLGTLAGLVCASAVAGAPAGGGVRWGYEGAGGPRNWGSLDRAYAACSDGWEQSPIDLGSAKAGRLPGIVFDYAPSPMTVSNNGHAIQVDYAPGSGIVHGGVRYELLQFHFHHGSEHTVAGVRFPLELHLVHRSSGGELAVVGVLFKEGAASEALEPLWSRLPAEAGATAAVPGPMNAAALLPERRSTWRYVGSLTTPPCTEGVSWIVMTEPMTLSAAQIEAFAAIFPNNYRPVQPLNGRVLWRDDGTR